MSLEEFEDMMDYNEYKFEHQEEYNDYMGREFTTDEEEYFEHG